LFDDEATEEQNNRRNYYPLESPENTVEKGNDKSVELPVTLDIQDTNQVDTTSESPEELNLVNPEKLAYILVSMLQNLFSFSLMLRQN
jgi:hypothetical protein